MPGVERHPHLRGNAAFVHVQHLVVHYRLLTQAAVTSTAATDVPHVNVQLLFAAFCFNAPLGLTAKPRVSPAGTCPTQRVVPEVESFNVTFVAVADVFATITAYRSSL